MIGMSLPALSLGAGVVLSTGLLGDSMAMRCGGVVLGSVSAVFLGTLVYVTRLPRLAYEDGHLLVYLRSLEPIRVPSQFVECFFLGQATSQLTRREPHEVVARTVVVRIAETADQWQRQNVKPALGQWCDGYVTIRGTWCEPLSVERVNELNRRLAEAHRAQSME